METSFLKTQLLQPFIWLKHIDDMLFIWTHREERYFSKILSSSIQTSNFGTKHLKIATHFLDRNLSLKDGAIDTDLHIKPIDGHVSHYK